MLQQQVCVRLPVSPFSAREETAPSHSFGALLKLIRRSIDSYGMVGSDVLSVVAGIEWNVLWNLTEQNRTPPHSFASI